MAVEIDEDNLKKGLLGLAVALVEIIEETLERQAIRRMDSGRLDEDEIERLGNALYDLRTAIDNIKEDNGLQESVSSVRDGLDNTVNTLLDDFLRLPEGGI